MTSQVQDFIRGYESKTVYSRRLQLFGCSSPLGEVTSEALLVRLSDQGRYGFWTACDSLGHSRTLRKSETKHKHESRSVCSGLVAGFISEFRRSRCIVRKYSETLYLVALRGQRRIHLEYTCYQVNLRGMKILGIFISVSWSSRTFWHYPFCQINSI